MRECILTLGDGQRFRPNLVGDGSCSGRHSEIDRDDHANYRFGLLRFGGAEGDRTPDLMTASHALSQLSYGPI